MVYFSQYFQTVLSMFVNSFYTDHKEHLLTVRKIFLKNSCEFQWLNHRTETFNLNVEQHGLTQFKALFYDTLEKFHKQTLTLLKFTIFWNLDPHTR
jgi:hypothetical protein